MRVLIDESLPVEIAGELPGFDVVTVHAQGWLHLRNGVLIREAVRSGFSVLLTADSKLRYQQNVAKIGIAVVVLIHVRNRIEDLRPLIPRIVDALTRIKSGEVVEIDG